MSQTRIVRYQASAPGAAYLASNLLGFTTNLRSDVIDPILDKYNVKEIKPDEWLDAQLQLDMLREIETQFSWEELVAVGMKAAEFVPIPDGMNTIERFLEGCPMLQQAIGHNMSPEEKLVVEQLDTNRYRMTLYLPTPPFVLYGFLYGLVKRVSTPNQYPVIKITDNGTPYVFEFKW